MQIKKKKQQAQAAAAFRPHTRARAPHLLVSSRLSQVLEAAEAGLKEFRTAQLQSREQLRGLLQLVGGMGWGCVVTVQGFFWKGRWLGNGEPFLQLSILHVLGDVGEIGPERLVQRLISKGRRVVETSSGGFGSCVAVLWSELLFQRIQQGRRAGICFGPRPFIVLFFLLTPH